MATGSRGQDAEQSVSGNAAVMLRRRARRVVDRQSDKEWGAGGHGRQREEARRTGSEAPMRAPATETVSRRSRA